MLPCLRLWMMRPQQQLIIECRIYKIMTQVSLIVFSKLSWTKKPATCEGLQSISHKCFIELGCNPSFDKERPQFWDAKPRVDLFRRKTTPDKLHNTFDCLTLLWVTFVLLAVPFRCHRLVLRCKGVTKYAVFEYCGNNLKKNVALRLFSGRLELFYCTSTELVLQWMEKMHDYCMMYCKTNVIQCM